MKVERSETGKTRIILRIGDEVARAGGMTGEYVVGSVYVPGLGDPVVAEVSDADVSKQVQFRNRVACGGGTELDDVITRVEAVAAGIHLEYVDPPHLRL